MVKRKRCAFKYKLPFGAALVLHAGAALAQIHASPKQIHVNVLDFGAQGNNLTDNKIPIKSAIEAVSEHGTLKIPAGEFNSTSGWIIHKSMKIECDPNTIIRLAGSGQFDASSHFVVESQIKQAYKFSGIIQKGSKTFIIARAAELRPRQEVLLRMGRDPYDQSQAYFRLFNRITAIRGNRVTFQKPVPERITGTSHEVLTFYRVIDGFQIRGCSFDYRDDFTGGGPDQTVTVEHTKNTRLTSLTGIRISGGLVNIENQNMTIDNWYVRRSYYRGYGGENVISGWGFTNARYSNIVAEQADHCGLYVESHARGLIVNNLLINKGPNGTSCPGVALYGASKGIQIRNYEFKAQTARDNNRALDTAGQNSQYVVRGATISEGTAFFPLDNVNGPLVYKGLVYPFTRTLHKRFRLAPDLKRADLGLPIGIYKSVWLSLSTLTGLKELYLGTGAGPTVDMLKVVPRPAFNKPYTEPSLTILGDQYPFNQRLDKRTFVTTEAAVPSNAFIDIDLEYFTTR